MSGLTFGWIGTGVMGSSMCAHLIKGGHKAFVFNRTKSKADSLIQLGATWCETPKQVAEKTNIIFTIVGFPQDVREVYFGVDGIFAGLRKDSIVVDMTTSEPMLAAEIAEKAQTIPAFTLDAPVSGGDVGAREGTLAIMVGGDKKAYDQVLPLFQLMGKTIVFFGPPGAGQHTKMCNQILIASTMVGVVECLLYAYKAGLNLDQVIDVIGKGAASSWSINVLGRRIVQKNFDPGFFIKHFVKDMGIALAEARRMNLSLPGLSLAYQFYVAAVAEGLENLGTHGLYKVLAQLNHILV